MANIKAAKRGWKYDLINGRLGAYVDGTEAFRLTKSSDGVDVRFFGDTPASNYLNYDASTGGLKYSISAATPTYADGYGVFEIDFSISGVSGNHVNTTSTWMNLGAAATVTEYAALHTDGYYDAGATLTGARLVWGKYACMINSDPLTNNLWNLNFVGANSEIDAIFYVNNADLALGYQAGTPTKVAVGSIPFYYESGGAGLRYIYLYDAADSD